MKLSSLAEEDSISYQSSNTLAFSGSREVNTPENLKRDDDWSSSRHFRFTFPRTRWYVIALILIAESSERLSYYVMSSTYKKILTTTFGYDNASAATNYDAFVQIGFISPVFFGCLADSYLGNYWTSLITFTFYLIGKLLMAFALDPAHLSEALLLVGAFGFITIGVGMKAVMMTFGADQLMQQEGENEEDFQSRRTRYFLWYYGALEVGAFISSGFLTTIATTGQYQGIQIVKKDRAMSFVYWLAFGVLTVALGSFALTYFWAVADSRRSPSRRCQRHRDSDCKKNVDAWAEMEGQGADTTMSGSSGIATAAATTITRAATTKTKAKTTTAKKKKTASDATEENALMRIVRSILHERRGRRGRVALFAWGLFIFTTLWSIILNIVGSKGVEWLSYLTLAFYALMNGLLAFVYSDVAWIEDKEIGKFCRVIPMSFLAYATFNIAKYNDPTGSACQADIRLFDATQNNAAELGMLQAVAVWICTLVMNYFVYPLCRRKQWNFTVKHRMLLAGGLLALMGASMIILETVRKTTPFVEPLEVSNCAHATKAAGNVYIRSLSAWWYVIPYMLLGFGESILYAAVGEYVYSVAPPSLASTAIGMWQMAYGLQPAIIHSVLQLLSVGWINADGNDYDKNHQEYVYALNTAVSVLGVVIFFFLPLLDVSAEKVVPETVVSETTDLGGDDQ